LEGFQDEVLEDLCSSYRGFLLLDLFGDVFVFIHVPVEILVLDIAEDVGQLGIGCGAQTYDRLSSERNNVHSNNHRFCVSTTDFVGNCESVVFIATLSIHLAQNI